MFNKLEALKTFCICADTLQFKETAHRMAVSPPVVTRTIAELEDHLGEALFQRNTRQVKLTAFGEQFLPQAQQLLEESERLFAPAQRRHAEEMSGLVRIAVPILPDNDVVLAELIPALSAYPNLILDWRVDSVRQNVVESQIDLGIRVGNPTDNRLIIRRVGTVGEKIVAAPSLIERMGLPKDIQALQQYFPLCGSVDANTGRLWSWYINEQLQFTPRQPAFIAADMYSGLQATRSGLVFSHQLDWLCEPYLATGDLVEIFAEIPKMRWPIYVYRPQQTVTPTRVKVVFDILVDILMRRYYSGENSITLSR